MTPTALVTVSMPKDLADKLREQARREDRSVSSLVRRALKAYFADHGQPTGGAA